MPIYPKLGIIVAYCDGLLLIKLHDPLIMYSWKIAWSFDYVFLKNQIILWLCILEKSHGKLKPLYPQYHHAYGHQTWQDDGLPWRTSTYKATWHFNHVDGSLSIKSHGPLITWFPKITGQTKTIVYPPPQCLWPQNLACWRLT